MEGIPSLERMPRTDWLSQLPEDVLWTILGFLDLATLYTARLVCKRFRMSAARHFKALHCKTLGKLPLTDFTQFSGTTYLAVTVFRKRHLHSLAHPWIAPVVTHVMLKGFVFPDSQTAEEFEAALVRLPKLQSVSIQLRPGESCLRLEELKETALHRLHHVDLASVRDVSPLTRCSQLTSLDVRLAEGAEASLGSLSSLCNLRSLNLCGCPSALGCLSTFTALTSLTFDKYIGEDAHVSTFQDLGRLTGLSRLVLDLSALHVTHEDLASIAQLTNLTCLDMVGCTCDDSAEGSTALTPLTRLVSVGFFDADCMPRLSRPQVEALHSLRLCDISDASLLQEATRLTHLDLVASPLLPGLCAAVAGMSRLRCLEIHLARNIGDPDDAPVFQLNAILRLCTMLTKLDYQHGELRSDSDLEACASLPGLRSLSFTGICKLTSAWIPALQAMSGLTELSLLCTGIRVDHMTPDVIAAFDAKRRQLGWPLLKLRIESWFGGRHEWLER